MSRTVRCKGLTPPESWLISEEEFDELKIQMWSKGYQKNWRHLVKDTFKETRKAELKKAHSDHGWRFFWQGNPPAAYRRDVAARRRAICKKDLRKSIKRDFGESYLPYYPRESKTIWYDWD